MAAFPEPRLVLADAYDRDAWSRAARALGKDLEELHARGKRLLPHFDALVEDLYCALFKLVVRVVPATEAPKSTALNRAVLAALLTAEGFAELKEETALDLARSAQGALVLARRALALLKGGEVLLEDELYTAQALASVEQELATKKAALADAKEQGSDLAELLEEQVEQVQARQDELQDELEKVVGELPDSFSRALTQTAEQLTRELPEGDERAASLSRSLGANGPSEATARLHDCATLRSRC